MASRLALIHTVGSLPAVFATLTETMLPGVTTTDTVDESLLAESIAAGRVQPSTAERLEGHVRAALGEGADLVLVTCSSMGPAVDELERRGLPVLRVDEALADAALAAGTHIGVIGTLRTTLEPTADLIRRRADDLGGRSGELQITTRLCEGAFDALKAGRTDIHDALVLEALRDFLPTMDVVVLAQASMARVAASLTPDERSGPPILSSPHLGVLRAAERLRSLGAGDEALQP
jgi:Asp/Glu/hydantoin racemase